ncbi:MAG TPA: DUF2723 domain-containing protein [Kofleriaceae bacterium]|nr:DUF2723 domain-containing protein [Kofleriaceae bacterium]
MNRLRDWGPRAVALAGFAGYALLVPPGPSGAESTELGAAGFLLGSPHATGFPLVVMLAKLATLVPVGEIGFRVHLLAAACAAAAMLWTARLVAAAAGARGQSSAAVIGGMVAALMVGVTVGFARQATHAGAIAPTVALLAATLLLFDRVARGGDAGTGMLLALLVGLGLGAHPGYRLLVPLPLAALLWIRLRRGARWPLAAPLVVIAVAAALQLYLPVRSATGRAWAADRDHPRDLASLGEHVLGPPIGLPADAAGAAMRSAAAALDEIGALGMLAAVAGALWLLAERRSRWLLLLLASAAAADAVGVAGQAGALSALVLATLAGVGIAWLGRFAGARAGAALTASAGVMILVAPFLVTWHAARAADVAATRAADVAALPESGPKGRPTARSRPADELAVRARNRAAADHQIRTRLSGARNSASSALGW